MLVTSLTIKVIILGASALILAASGSLLAQGYVMPSEPILISLPTAIAPPGAWLQETGNIVKVSVSIDTKGRVLSVDSVRGPGFTCDGSTLPGLILLREAARLTALKAVFTPAMAGKKTFPSIATIDVVFPDPPKDKNPSETEQSKIEPLTDKPASQETKPGNGDVINGKATYLPKPIYPTVAESDRTSGSVLIRVIIAEDGSVISAQPEKADPVFGEVARIAACKATFSPTLLNGLPVKVSGFITYNFTGRNPLPYRRRN